MDLGPEFRKSDLPIIGKSIEGALKTAQIEPPLETKEWLTLNNYYGYYFFDDYNLVASSPTTEIWLQVDYNWLSTDTRDAPIVTQEMLDYLLVEFDSNIYPTDTSYFGTEDFHNGSYSLLVAWGYEPPGYYESPEGKQTILLSNIRDENYYNSSYPSYIAGFYSPTYEAYFDRNIINIDVYDWVHRVGTSENPWFINDDRARPNLYESVIAHEYQHLIHDDYVAFSESWMNEACSLFAEPLCGYELDAGQIEWFLATPDNSLTEWNDQGDINILADYGASFLWALYLTDHYGINIMGDYVQQGIAGIEGLNLLLPKGHDFERVFHDWRLANLIHAKHGKYGYQLNELSKYYNPGIELNFDELEPLNIHVVPGKEVEWTSAFDEFGETITKGTTDQPQGYHTDKYLVGPYSTEYISFPDLKGLNVLKFDGDPLSIYGWTWDDLNGAWWSGDDNLMDGWLVSDPYTVEAEDVLQIVTWWDIEDNYPTTLEGWDYGFIQISTDGGNSWTSMSDMDGIIDFYNSIGPHPSAHPNIVAQLPGITGWSGDWEDKIVMSFNLEDYAEVEQEVLFNFRYMTDWYTTYTGWYIFDANVDGNPLVLTPVYPETEFMVTVVKKFTWKGRVHYVAYDMWLNCYDYGSSLAYARPGRIEVILVVSHTTLKGITDYQFAAKPFRWPRWRCW
jgi:hypothetical protein